MDKNGWFQFLEGFPWFRGENKFPLRAYSEYMPPVRTGISVYSREIDSRVSISTMLLAGRFPNLRKNIS